MRLSVGKIPERLTVKLNKTEGILNWDTDNCYPQRIIALIQASGRALSCTDVYAKFIEGDGFKDVTFYKSKVNYDGLTMDKLLRMLIADYSKLRGFAIHINYNALFKITELNFVPFEHTRLSAPDDEYSGKIAIYPDWDKSRQRYIKKSDLDFINVFNPDPEIIQYQVDSAGGWDQYKGQILWYSGAGMNTYPTAIMDSVIEDVDTDAQIKVFKNRNARVGFIEPVMMVHKGKFETEKERDIFMAALKKYQGAEQEGNIMLIEVNQDEEIPELKQFTATDKDRKYENTEKTIHDNIRRSVLVPKVLVSDDVPGSLGASNEINNACVYYSALTNKERRIFEETFQMLYPYMQQQNNASNDFSIIPIKTILPVATSTPAP